MLRKDNVILVKIIEEIGVACDIIKELSFDEFNNNEITKRAICMTVINIGELVKNLSDDLRNKYNHIPWKFIAGFRDIAAHKYQTLKMNDVYKTVIEDFPELKKNIENILKEWK